MAHKINNINTSLEKINKQASDFGLQITLSQLVPAGQLTTLSRESDSFLDNSTVFGRKDDASKIVGMLIGSDGNKEEEVLSVIPIVGIGGLGKTTLAKLIYNHESVMRCFDLRIWICVSTNFDTNRLLVEILESLQEKKCEVTSRDVVLRDLEKVLGGKKYLLVLDDVWNENAVEWDEFKSCLLGVSGTNKGNNIVLTTRKQGVASITGSCRTHYLEGLSEDDCLSVFKQKAFATGGATMTPELEAIGIEMVKKCRGVPLAAKVLGAMMFSKKERHEWLTVLERETRVVGDENGVKDILKLSFDNLPSHSSKQCFAYCSITREDSVIEKAKLIQLWMAVGLLELDEGSDKEVEDTGSDIFKVFLQSSLFQDVQKDQYDNIIGCKMHDLVHDLAKSISKFESFSLEDSVVNDIPDPVRHLALHSREKKKICPILSREKARYLHTLILNSDVPNSLSDFQYLRVLTLESAGIEDLSNSIGELIHLRYLDLSWSPIKRLPKSICKLYNLQTLRLDNYSYVKVELPDELSNLIGLRHLHYNHVNYTGKMPLGMGRLTCLQTLSSFRVGQEKGRRIEELGCLKQIRGEITIQNLEEVNSREEAQKADLFGKKNLYKLVLEWTDMTGVDSTNDEEVLEGLQPHPNLKSLSIDGFSGDKFPLWMMNMAVNIDGRGSSFNNLVDISLKRCKRCEHIPMLGHLPHLQKLKLWEMDEVKSIDVSSNGHHHSIASTSSISCDGETPVLFPALVSLSLYDMPNLEEWMEADGVLMFPCLKVLEISNCPKLTTFPSRFPCLKKLWVSEVNSNLFPHPFVSREVVDMGLL